jgi:hypothetical protein
MGKILALLLVGCLGASAQVIPFAFLNGNATNAAGGGGGGGGSATDPNAFWWAQTTISGAAGSEMLSWADSSGNGKSIAALGTPSGAYVSNNVENGKSALFFIDVTLMTSSVSLTVPYCIAGVMRSDTSGADRRAIFSSSQNRVISFERSGFASAFVGSVVANYSPPTGTAHVFFLNVWAGGAEYWIDGTNRTASVGVTGDWPDVALGSDVSHSETSFHYIFDLRGWTNGLTTNEMNTVAHSLTNIAGRWSDLP